MKFYSTGELARRLGKCRESINYYIKTGKIKPSAKVQERFLFTEEDLVAIEQTLNQPTQPKRKG